MRRFRFPITDETRLRYPKLRTAKANDHWDEVSTQRITNAEKKNRVPKDYEQPQAPPHSMKETEQWLNLIWSDEWWVTQMPISTYALDAVCGTGRVRQAFNPNSPEKLDETLKRISWLIPDIKRRALVFPRTMHLGVKGIIPKFLRLEPPIDTPKIAKLALESAWSLWARCVSCGSNQFLPVIVSGEAHAACYVCCHPEKNSYGGKLVKRSLIHEALKKYY